MCLKPIIGGVREVVRRAPLRFAEAPTDGWSNVLICIIGPYDMAGLVRQGGPMTHELSTVVFGLTASLAWGAGDFSGGLATRRANVFSVVIAAHAIGLVLLVALALAWSEPFPSALDLVWGTAAGLAGAVGLAAFYRALAVGRMGITAPVTAVLAAAVPVLDGTS